MNHYNGFELSVKIEVPEEVFCVLSMLRKQNRFVELDLDRGAHKITLSATMIDDSERDDHADYDLFASDLAVEEDD